MLDMKDFPQNALCLLFSDGQKLVLSKKNIETYSESFLNNPEKVPAEVREAYDFQACPICPKKHTGEFCHALRPTLPFLEVVDNYRSHDMVTAVFRDEENVVQFVTTTMQQALRSVSALSLLYYCEKGRVYWKYMFGVTPLMQADRIASRIYLNMFWDKGGDSHAVRTLIDQFHSDISMTSECQVRRLSMICKKDAFLNAFVKTQIITEILSMNMEETLRAAFEAFQADARSH